MTSLGSLRFLGANFGILGASFGILRATFRTLEYVYAPLVTSPTDTRIA
jgi:hypothetical protein